MNIGVNHENYIFPYHLFSCGDKVVLYGLKYLSAEFSRQSTKTNYIKIVYILNENGDVNKLANKQYDAILLTVIDYISANTLKQKLMKCGIRSEKIKWEGSAYCFQSFLENVYFPLLNTVDFYQRIKGISHCTQEYIFKSKYKENNINFFDKNDEEKWNRSDLIIDVAVPIYNAYEFTKTCIDSVLKNTTIPYNLYLVNDSSTDKRIHDFLVYIGNHNDSEYLNTISIIEHNNNKGFLKTINEIMSMTCHHLVILNTDTEVPPNWLQRLVAPILDNDKIASVTPTTNAASICSFPVFGSDNELPDGCTVEDVDKAFSYISMKPIELVTGVGFCMAMNRRAINQIGKFDTVFGKGYGEETDWCMRASSKGWKNVWCLNLFVYHKHGASFGGVTSSKKKNKELIHERYKDLKDESLKLTMKREWEEAYSWVNFLLETWKSTEENIVYLGTEKKDFLHNQFGVEKLDGKGMYSWKVYQNECCLEYFFSIEDMTQEDLDNIFSVFRVGEIVALEKCFHIPLESDKVYEILRKI